MNNQKRLLAELIHEDTKHEDRSVLEYFQDGDRIDWPQSIAKLWAVLALVISIFANL